MRKNLKQTYNKTNIKKELTDDDVVFFYNKERYLNQWSGVNFTDGTFQYTCMEQYMMQQKALLFNDMKSAFLIMMTNNPSEHKRIGREVKDFDQKIWDEYKFSIIVQGNKMKFSQNKEHMNYLLNTGDKIIVEASPKDTIWGIGMDDKNKNRFNVDLWRGENLLGFALMQVRDELRKGK